MTIERWYSTRVRLACLVAPDGAIDFADSIFVFRSSDFRDAFESALTLGRSLERTYTNAEGVEVRWRLKEIVSLDAIAAESIDGAEVFSEPVELERDESYPFDFVFTPEASEPTQTI